jgi:shikimate dehydrogenase
MTDRYAVFGNPIAHSLSPLIHSSFAEQTGQDINYQRQLVVPDQFDCAARGFFGSGGLGLNITVPFKLEAYRFADQLSVGARRAGAVNTLLCQQDGLVLGDNTDGIGLVRDITNNLDYSLQGRRVLVLGAGGAVRGVLAPLLLQQPGQLVIANRTSAKAQQLALAFGAQGSVIGLGYEALQDVSFDLVINGTSASLVGKMPDLPEGVLAPHALVLDMVYGAEPTPFMNWASARGAARVADGLGMLVEQAAESFYLWRGVMPRTVPVIRSVREFLVQAISP